MGRWSEPEDGETDEEQAAPKPGAMKVAKTTPRVEKKPVLPPTFVGDLQVLLDKVASSLGKEKLAGHGAVVNAHRRLLKWVQDQ